VGAKNGQLTIDGSSLTFSAATKPADVACDRYGVDVVLECSGKFRTTDTLDPYFASGVKKVIVAAPVKSGPLNIVVGVNDHLYDPATHRLLTAASCTTICLAPVVKVVHESIGPELLGKLTGVAVRVPLLNASLTDCVFEVRRPTTVEEVNAAFKHPECALEGIWVTKSARSTSRTTPDPPSLTPRRPWSWTARASKCWPGTTTRSATSTR
jgi:glyceraldehyde 3-phosphate dehydrogenase